MTARLPLTAERRIHDGSAALSRQLLAKNRVFAVSIFGGPGTGKTSLLEATLPRIGKRARTAVILGNLEAEQDARRLSKHCGQIIPIETIDLTPELLHEAIARLDLAATDILFIERGAETPPHSLDLGQSATVGLFSLTGGDDKVRHHPERVEHADLVLLSKIDLLPFVPFDTNRFHDSVRIMNPSATILNVSITTGQGMDAWCDWLLSQADQCRRHGEQGSLTPGEADYFIG